MLTLSLMVGACGSGDGRSVPRDATVVLDFTPNPIHVGIYSAIARGFAATAGVRLHVLVPGASTDAPTLLERGRASLGILDLHDLALARERGSDLVGIMAIVERPLAAVIGAPGIGRPRKLEGRVVGLPGLASDLAVLRSVVSGAGGNPDRVRTVTIGFGAVPALLAGRVSAATAFWNDEGVTLARRRPGFRVFRVDAYGAPAYPELVLCASRARLRRDPGLAAAVVHALVRGYAFAAARPTAALADLRAAVPGLDASLAAAQLAAVRPAFRGPHGRIGELDPSTLARWARWEARFGIVPRPPDVRRMFDRASLGSWGP